MSDEPSDDEPTMILMWDRLEPKYLDIIADTMGIPKGQLALTRMSKVFKKFADQMFYANQYNAYQQQLSQMQYQQQAMKQQLYSHQALGTTSGIAQYNNSGYYLGNTTGITTANCTISQSAAPSGITFNTTNPTNNTATQQGYLSGLISKLGNWI